ncbi:MAG: SH3 domain-containing protein [Saprospiraceae bacterium]|nr:SH3 domain-containing protein [Saprospiraceae bacterium]
MIYLCQNDKGGLFMVFWRWVICLALLWGGCKNKEVAPVGAPAKPEAAVEEVIVLTASVDHLRVRATPDPDGEVVHALREGEAVQWTGEESDRRETVNLRGKPVTAPWYRIRMRDGRQGWAFGGGLQPWQSGKGLAYAACLDHYNRADFSGFYPCLDRVSHTLSGPEHVEVTSKFLRLRMTNGKVRQFNHDRTPGPDYRFYQYLGDLPGPDCHVVKINRQGGSSFLLVDRRNGEDHEVAGIPYPLPLTRAVFCLGAFPGTPGTYTMEVVIPESRQFRTLLSEQFPEQSLTGITWQKDGQPAFTMRDQRGNPAVWRLIYKGKDEWALEPAT